MNEEKIIDGTNATLGRLASFSAKQALQGSKIVILNSENVMITGSKKDIAKKYHERRNRVGHSQKGPKHSTQADKIVKRAIRGMLPNHRFGRGRDAFKRIRCYIGVPKKYADSKKIIAGKEKGTKFIHIKDIAKAL